MPFSRKQTDAPPAPKRAKKPARVRVKKVTKPRKKQFMLFIGDDGAILVYMESKTVVRRLFAPTASAEHTRAMAELMAAHPDAPLSLVVDVMDQQYVRQTFPPVSALSVQGLVNRKLDRDFPPEDLRGSIRLGREESARKDWVFLLISLVNTANLQQWIELVVEKPNRLLGVFLLPVECQQILPLLSSVMPERPAVKASWQMIISNHKVSGFRIVVLREGKLAFTRVSQAIGEAVADVIAGNVEQEIQNTVEYIRRLGYNEGSGLEVFAILAAEVRDAVDAKRINAAAVNMLSPLDVAEALGLHQAALAADRFGDVVMASAYALLGAPSLRLYPAYAKKLDQVFKARVGAKVAAVAIAGLILVMTGNVVVEAFNTRAQSRQARESIEKNAPSLALLKTQVEKLGSDANYENDVAAFYDKMKPVELAPFSVVGDITEIKRPDVTLDEWEWVMPTVAAPDASQPQGGAASAAGAPPANMQMTIKVKALLNGSFPDNETIIAAVDGYKNFLNEVVTRYTVSVNNPGIGKGSDDKISLAFSGDNSAASAQGRSGNTKSTTLQITMVGPKPETKKPEPAAGVAP
jgi:hypothetical protein